MKINEYLTRDDIVRFTAKSDLQAWRLVLGNWLAIAAIFGVVGAYPNPFVILFAMILLGRIGVASSQQQASAVV